MCAHGRGRNPVLPPEYTAATSGEVRTLFGVCFVFPKLLTPACLLEVLHLEVYDCFPFFLTPQEHASLGSSNYCLTL